MPQENYQKIKLLKLVELLQQESDEDHPLRTRDICKALAAMHISCDRRTLGRDIKLLREQGFEIMSELEGHENIYWISDRSFSVPELKILIDAVQAAGFIPREKTDALIDKIAALGGSHAAEVLKANLVCFNTRKHTNNEILYSVDALERALQQGKQVTFCYFDLDARGKRVYRKNGSRYTTDPMALVYSEDTYYLIGYSAKYDAPTHYRVDRMERVTVLETEVAPAARLPEEDLGEYTRQVFRMYRGDPQELTLAFSPEVLGPVYDQFGENITVAALDDSTLCTTVRVQVSPTFWGWLFQMGGQMRVLGPEAAVTAYREMLAAAAAAYTE